MCPRPPGSSRPTPRGPFCEPGGARRAPSRRRAACSFPSRTSTSQLSPCSDLYARSSHQTLLSSRCQRAPPELLNTRWRWERAGRRDHHLLACGSAALEARPADTLHRAQSQRESERESERER
eukprot:430750-Rhodomonas_salina.5